MIKNKLFIYTSSILLIVVGIVIFVVLFNPVYCSMRNASSVYEKDNSFFMIFGVAILSGLPISLGLINIFLNKKINKQKG